MNKLLIVFLIGLVCIRADISDLSDFSDSSSDYYPTSYDDVAAFGEGVKEAVENKAKSVAINEAKEYVHHEIFSRDKNNFSDRVRSAVVNKGISMAESAVHHDIDHEINHVEHEVEHPFGGDRENNNEHGGW